MRSFFNYNVIVLFTVLLISPCTNVMGQNSSLTVKVNPVENEQRVDIFIGGELFTSYLYTDTIPDLKKTVLFPIKTANGNDITRGFPLHPRKGERVDHPHHIGLWLNYGNVNNLDYWNNSNAIPSSRFYEMGAIRHNKILSYKNHKNIAHLQVEENWLKPDNSILLKENTKFIFHAESNLRIIDRLTTLTALNEEVTFHDTKEGMMAIRLTRALEHPTDKPIILSDVNGNKTSVPVLDNSIVTGHYINSNGVEGLDVWGKRSKWVALTGEIQNEIVTVAIFDHPRNTGYPAYWHARGYGLFSVNPLGQRIFSNGKENMDLKLNPGESTFFYYRILIISGETNTELINSKFQDFLSEYK